MATIKHDNKVLIFDSLEDAQEVVSRFEENYTNALPNKDATKWSVYIGPLDRHKLTQEERDSMQILPIDYYGNEE